MLRETDNAVRVLESGLFNHSHYASLQTIGSTDPLRAVQHYLEEGERVGLSPNPLFNPSWYTGRWNTEHPLLDYLACCKEHDPHPLFDTAFYLNQGVSLHDGDTPLAHYIRTGWRGGLDPHPLFSTTYYLKENPDVFRLGYDPLTHFLSNGWYEGRNPCSDFDIAFYRERYPDVACSGVNPLMHYLSFGARETRNPSAEFDSAWYDAQLRANGVPAEDNPLAHYRVVGKAAGWLPKRAEWSLNSRGMLAAEDAGAWARNAFAQAAATAGHPRPIAIVTLNKALPALPADGLILFLQGGDVLRPGALAIMAGASGLLTTFDAMSPDSDGTVLPVLLPGSNPLLLENTPILPPFCVDSAFYRDRPLPPDGDADTVLAWFRRLVCEAAAVGGLRHLPVPIADVPLSRHRQSHPELLPEVQRIVRAICTPAETPSGDVSVVICTKDAGHLLTQLIVGMLQPPLRQLREVVLVLNRPVNGFARAYHTQLRGIERVKIIDYDKPYNFSDQANVGAQVVSGDFVLLLNDDIVPIGHHWLSHLLAPLLRPKVAITGPLLLYPDETVQHAGMFMGFNNVAGHTLRGARLPDTEVAAGLLPQNCSAVTGAAMLVRRTAWDALAGFDTQLATYLQDVDLCLRAHRMGWEVAFTPDSVLFHMESISAKAILRDPAMLECRGREHARFVRRWREAIFKDPFRSPHWSKQDETMRTITALSSAELQETGGG